MPPFEIGYLLLRLGTSLWDWVPPFEIGVLPFEIGYLLIRLGTSLRDWVPPVCFYSGHFVPAKQSQ